MGDSPPLIWGTYRAIRDQPRVFDILSKLGLEGIDTAPNYQLGEAEVDIGKLRLASEIKVFGKVGYTHGDPPNMAKLSAGSRHCLTERYIVARASLSSERVFPHGGQFESLLLHNPEHLWERFDRGVAEQHLFMALNTLAGLAKAGVTRTIGISSWTWWPGSALLSHVFELIFNSDLRQHFSYYMYPVNVIRREVFHHRTEAVPGAVLLSPQLLGSAPLAGGQAVNLLGPMFSRFFAGIKDPVLQSLMLAQCVGSWPCLGVTSPDRALGLRNLRAVPRMAFHDLSAFLKLIDGE